MTRRRKRRKTEQIVNLLRKGMRSLASAVEPPREGYSSNSILALVAVQKSRRNLIASQPEHFGTESYNSCLGTRSFKMLVGYITDNYQSN